MAPVPLFVALSSTLHDPAPLCRYCCDEHFRQGTVLHRWQRDERNFVQHSQVYRPSRSFFPLCLAPLFLLPIYDFSLTTTITSRRDAFMLQRSWNKLAICRWSGWGAWRCDFIAFDSDVDLVFFFSSVSLSTALWFPHFSLFFFCRDAGR